MRKILFLFMFLTTLVVLVSCADNKTIDGVTYRPYGLLNENECKNDSIQYEVSGWAVFSGVVFFECVVPPIYTFGYNLWEPVGKKKDYVSNPQRKGIIQ